MAFVIPTIYTAVDKVTAVTNSIARSNELLALKMQRSANAIMPINDDAIKRRFTFMASMAKAMAVVGTGLFAGKSIVEYEDAVASFRTIVSELNDTDFSEFKRKITDVAYATNKGTVEVAQSFEKIAGLNAKFADTAEGLGLVSTAAITLAKASRMELGSAAESLVGIMNQFSMEANQADRVINALAAGQAVGAASISQTAIAMTNFGASAKSANVSVEQSVALIQILAKYGQLGADAGDKLRTSFIRIQQTGAGYKTGTFDIVEALTELKKRYDSLGSAYAKDKMLADVFGATQIITGQILLNNIGLFKEVTTAVTGTSEAQKAAEINSRTLSNRFQELAKKFQTIVTTSKYVGVGVNMIISTMQFLTNHMEFMLTVLTLVAGGFVAVRGAMLLMTLSTKIVIGAMAAWNYMGGLATIILGRYELAVTSSTARLYGISTALWFANKGWLASIGIIGLVVAALTTLVSWYNSTYVSSKDLTDELIKNKQGFLELKNPISESTVALEKYNKAYTDYISMTKARFALSFDAEMRRKTGNGLTFGDRLAMIPDYFRAGYFASRLQKSGIIEGYKQPSMPEKSDFGLNEKGEYTGFKSTTSSTQKVEHFFKIELTENGKTVRTIDSANLTPSVKSTSSYNGR